MEEPDFASSCGLSHLAQGPVVEVWKPLWSDGSSFLSSQSQSLRLHTSPGPTASPTSSPVLSSAFSLISTCPCSGTSSQDPPVNPWPPSSLAGMRPLTPPARAPPQSGHLHPQVPGGGSEAELHLALVHLPAWCWSRGSGGFGCARVAASRLLSLPGVEHPLPPRTGDLAHRNSSLPRTGFVLDVNY